MVFVHGLQGHPKKTWTAKCELDTTTSASSNHGVSKSRNILGTIRRRLGPSSGCDQTAIHEVFWPESLLPQHCPSARIMTWGYDSVITKFFGGPSNQNTFYDHANDLFWALKRQRKFKVGNVPLQAKQ